MHMDRLQRIGDGEQEQEHIIRILLVDDHALVREGTRRLIETESDVVVVAEASSGEEAIEIARKLLPDIAIMDIAMPGMGGIEATRALKKECPETAVLILSAYDDEPYLLALLDAGAAGFFTHVDICGAQRIVFEQCGVERQLRVFTGIPDAVLAGFE